MPPRFKVSLEPPSPARAPATVFVTTFHLDGELTDLGLTFSNRDEAHAYAMLVERVQPNYVCKVTETKLDGDWRDNLNALAEDAGNDQVLDLSPTLLTDIAAAVEAKRRAQDPVDALLSKAVPPPKLTF